MLCIPLLTLPIAARGNRLPCRRDGQLRQACRWSVQSSDPRHTITRLMPLSHSATGSMRPFTDVGYEGNANIYSAFTLAVAPDAAGRGTMIAFNDRIVPAHWAMKFNGNTPVRRLLPRRTPDGSLTDGLLAGRVQGLRAGQPRHVRCVSVAFRSTFRSMTIYPCSSQPHAHFLQHAVSPGGQDGLPDPAHRGAPQGRHPLRSPRAGHPAPQCQCCTWCSGCVIVL